jgi:alpha-tubulin suppressor-like RCC1 family protein
MPAVRFCASSWVVAFAALLVVTLAPASVRAQEVPEANCIDVLMVYTPAVRAALGGEDGVKAYSIFLLEATNQAFVDSKITGLLRLARAQEVNYTESSTDYSVDLSALTERSDGVMDEVHDLRNEVGADVVTLLRLGSVNGTAGLAWLLNTLGGFPDHAFSVVGINMGSYTYAHELGHNLGMAHERGNGGGGIFSYSWGHAFRGTDGVYYGTIMSYAGQGIGHFSNPNVSYMGAPTGVPEEDTNRSADGAKTLNQTIPVTARYRAYVPGLPSPVITPPGGNFEDEVTVSIAMPEGADTGTALRYTTDGTNVTEKSPHYTEPFVMPYSGEVRARAFRSGALPSEQVSETYNIQYPNTMMPVTIKADREPDYVREDGTPVWKESVSVILETATPEAQIYYTLDGTTVSQSSSTYRRPILLFRSTELAARAYKPKHNLVASTEASFVVEIVPVAEAPAIEVPDINLVPGGDGQTYNGPVWVTLVPSAPGDEVRYMVNNSTVNESSRLYTEPFLVTRTSNIYARSYRAGHKPSETANRFLQINKIPIATPIIHPGSGVYTQDVKVSISVATPGIVLRYTTNGDDVAADSAIYTGAFVLSQSTTVKVRGYHMDYLPSEQARADFVVRDPAEITRLRGAQTAAGSGHSLFMTEAGELRAFGKNLHGQLGTGDTLSRFSPVPVARDVAAVATQYEHTLYITRDNHLWGMGRNDFGQLGLVEANGSVLDKLAPTHITSEVLLVAVGGYHSLFSTIDGGLYTMGRNNYGQLGIASVMDAHTPTLVTDDAFLVAAGMYHSLFTTGEGVPYAFGRNDDGQLGTGNFANQRSPARVSIEGGTAVIISLSAGEAHSLFLTSDGTLYGTGSNTYGQLGKDPTVATNKRIFAPVLIARNVKAVAAGGYHTLYVTTDEELYAMGRNDNGQLGDNTTDDSWAPIHVASNVTSVSAGAAHSIYTLRDGTRLSVGSNSSGQLGDGTDSDRSAAVVVPTLPLVASPTFTPIAGQYEERLEVKLQNAASAAGAIIRYTLDGSDVTPTSAVYSAGAIPVVTVTTSTGPLSLVVKARAYMTGASPSIQVKAQYVVVPVQGRRAPEISRQPRSQAVAAGHSASFTVIAAGTPTPAYQWFFDGRAIVGANAPVYKIERVGNDNTGTYWVEVSNVIGSVSSESVSLVLDLPPVVTRQPVSQNIYEGDTLSLNVTVSNESASQLSYQWYRDGTAILGATEASYSLPDVRVSQGGAYDVVVFNSAGFIRSAKAIVNVIARNGPPLILRQPAPRSELWQGAELALSVHASSPNSSTLSYQWYRNGKQIRGAKNEELVIKKVSTGDDGEYTVVVSNSSGETRSAVARVVVQLTSKPKIVAQLPKMVATGNGKTVTLSVEATANPPPTYQWYRNGKPVPGATSASYTIENANSDDLGTYYVVVSSGVRKVTSAKTNLLFVSPPQILSQPRGEVFALQGKGVELSVKVASNKVRPTYQWYLDGVPLDGATAAKYKATESGIYTVAVKNGAGETVAEIARVKVIVPPKISSFNASNTSIVAGDPVSFEVNLAPGTGTPDLVYIWLKNGKVIADAPNAPIFTLVGLDKTAKISVRVTNGGGKAVGKASSSAITVRVVAPPSVTRHPVNLELRSGQTGKLTVVAAGLKPFTYQWYKDGVRVEGATGNTLTLTRVTAADAGIYHVAVNNPTGRTVVSNAAEVRVISSDVAGSLSSIGGDFSPIMPSTVSASGVLSFSSAATLAPELVSACLQKRPLVLLPGDKLVFGNARPNLMPVPILEILGASRLVGGVYTYELRENGLAVFTCTLESTDAEGNAQAQHIRCELVFVENDWGFYRIAAEATDTVPAGNEGYSTFELHHEGD